MPSAKKLPGKLTPVETFLHTEDQRANIPTAELETFMREEDRLPKRVTYPRPSDLLYPRNPVADPQLVWRGKDDQDRHPLGVTAPPIYIQEKIHPKAIIEDLRKQTTGEAPLQADLFADFNGIEFDDLVDFYQHEQHWSNRMILGDSLEVMTSLADREGLKGQVQCIYMDPPYGIRFGSNWQVSTRDRNVTDSRTTDATRQPEQVKAYRDTWELGVHSYLSYLRDRLMAARQLLSKSGSVFVQMGDENAHLVRALLDEVFGPNQFVAEIHYYTTSGRAARVIDAVTDRLLWYANDKDAIKYHDLWHPRSQKTLAEQYTTVEFPDGQVRRATAAEINGDEHLPTGARRLMAGDLSSSGASVEGSRDFEWDGVLYRLAPNTHWKTNANGLQKLGYAGRLLPVGQRLRYKRFEDDFPYVPYTNVWDDTVISGFATEKLYVVQTSTKVVDRCIQMATDPGDLVLDPTCGSGTTAYVAEQSGRRWITIDTSRVALTLARQRLMAARLPMYSLADKSGKDLRRGFVCRSVPHVTLKSIANNADLTDGLTRGQIETTIAKHVDHETLYDQPEVDRSVIRVTGPFTVESLSPSLGAPIPPADDTSPSLSDSSPDFVASIVDNLRIAGVQNTVRAERLRFDALELWPGKFIQAVGEYSEQGTPRRAAITIGPQYTTVDADLVRDAAKEAAGFFDILVVCGFAFDAYIANEFKQLGNLTILKANMNPDLSIGGDLLKKTGSGNLFTVFGEPDIDVRPKNGQVELEIRGLDVYDPTTGQIRSHTTADIACWFIDTAYDGNSFFVRHAYFTGADNPYKALKAALRADIDEAAWSSLYSTVSRPFDAPASGRIAVKVINHYGDEVMKVYEIAEAKMLELPQAWKASGIAPAELLVADTDLDQV